MSTFLLYGEIKFPKNNGRQAFKIRRLTRVKIESSWQSLTDSAEIILPRRVRDFDPENITSVFREGDPLEIWLGYNGDLTLEFTGYVKQVPAGVPLIISCENEMYKLKRSIVSVSKTNCSLKALLQAIAPGYTIKCDETKILGSVRYAKTSAASILDELKNAGIHCWFEGKVLHAFNSSKSDLDPVPILIEKAAGETLKQKAVENTLVTIRLLRKGAKDLKVEYGEKFAGKHISRKINGISMTTAEMMTEAKKIYALAKQPGLDGDISLFGIPRVQHGMKIKLRSLIYPEKDGYYYIDAVTKTFDLENPKYRQDCKIGDKVA